MTVFGAALLSARRGAGVSQLTVAERAGVARSYVSRLENGEREPTREVVALLADALGLTNYARANLFLSAGYVTDDVAWDGTVIELASVLSDTSIPPGVRREVRSAVKMAVRYALSERWKDD